MWRLLIVALFLVWLFPCHSFAQVAVGPVPEMPRMVQHLRETEIRAALDLTDEQAGEIDYLIERRQQILSTMMSQLRSLPQEQRREVWNATQTEMKSLEENLFRILLPFQTDRLKQIDFQMLVQADSASGGLTNKRMVEALGLSSAQEEAIQADLKKAEAELKEKIDALRKEIIKAKEEARKKVLKYMTDEQREKYLKLVGDVIDRGNQ